MRPSKGAPALGRLEQAAPPEPLAPRQYNPAVNRDLETVCLKCLEKQPHKRYDSALALAEDLERFLRGEPVHARPVGRWGRGWRWARRNPGLASLTATVALLLVAVAGIALAAAVHYANSSTELAEANN